MPHNIVPTPWLHVQYVHTYVCTLKLRGAGVCAKLSNAGNTHIPLQWLHRYVSWNVVLRQHAYSLCSLMWIGTFIRTHIGTSFSTLPWRRNYHHDVVPFRPQSPCGSVYADPWQLQYCSTHNRTLEHMYFACSNSNHLAYWAMARLSG